MSASEDRREQRVFTSYAVITFFADDEEQASQMLYALEDAINATPGAQTALDEECYEWVSPSDPDRQWVPDRGDAA